ncbi:MAG: hypothetical protein WCA10_19540 [Terracidiphilus sp.]
MRRSTPAITGLLAKVSAEDQLIELPDADPLVRWCGRGGEATLPYADF